MKRLLGIGLPILLTACSSASPRVYEAPTAQDRNPVRALELSREAADVGTNDPVKTEALLREALTEDLFCGAAHNNLGVLYLSQGKLYEAANELEWARKLLPGTPEPRLNLALVLERAGQLQAAAEACNAALEIAPEHAATLQAWVQLEIRRGKRSRELAFRLEWIALRGETEAWRRWAREQQWRLSGTESRP